MTYDERLGADLETLHNFITVHGYSVFVAEILRRAEASGFDPKIIDALTIAVEGFSLAEAESMTALIPRHAGQSAIHEAMTKAMSRALHGADCPVVAEAFDRHAAVVRLGQGDYERSWPQ